MYTALHGLRTHDGKIPNSLQHKFKSHGIWVLKLVFCRNNGALMESIARGLTVQKWVLITWPKIPQMTQNLSAQFVCPSPKVRYVYITEKRLHWASVVRAAQGIVMVRVWYLYFQWTPLNGSSSLLSRFVFTTWIAEDC